MILRRCRQSRRTGLRPALESLEPRCLLASLPTGALPDDTGEYMLGDIVVSVVLMESTPALAPHDTSTEDWTAADIQDVKTKVNDALAWWKSVLQAVSPAMGADLNFYVDYTYADAPVQTGYEPINRISNDFQYWMYDFLDKVQFNTTHDFSQDIRAFNNYQRTNGTADHPGPADWGFTLFVVNSTKDSDDAFAPGGSFARAFAFAGGRMAVIPSGRPAASYAHEIGHMFWAMDEYAGNSATAQRGYYNSPNSNAVHTGYTQLPSIMTNGDLMQQAWDNHDQAAATLEMMGWRDSDNDGIFDVLDVPFDLTGLGKYDPASGKYYFRGQSSVRALPNVNSSGLQSDITINEITRAEYRIDGGPWQTAANYNAPSATLDFNFPVSPSASLVEIRTIDTGTGVTSPIFAGHLTRPDTEPLQGINGFVWNDTDHDGVFEPGESGLGGWTMQLVGADGKLLQLKQTYEPDNYTPLTVLNAAKAGVNLLALGDGTDGSVSTLTSNPAATGTQVFATYDVNLSSWTTTWNDSTRRLRAKFTTPVSEVSIDAIGNSAGDYGRLEAYNASDQLIARYTTGPLASGQVATMTIERPSADIAYIVAKSHAGSEILLDHLTYGSDSAATTGASGEYALPWLPAGTYTVHAVPPSWFSASGPLPSNQEIVLANGDARSHVDFAAQGIVSPWQNPADPFDVNNDGVVAPIDALLIINDLNAHGSRQLPAPGPGAAPPPFLDANGDSFSAPLDALLVINSLNQSGNSEGPGGSASSNSGGASSSGVTAISSAGAANGEDLPAPLAAAATAPSRGTIFAQFLARGRTVESLAPQPTSASSDYAVTSDPIDDALAADVYRAWVRARDAAVDLSELDAT